MFFNILLEDLAIDDKSEVKKRRLAYLAILAEGEYLGVKIDLRSPSGSKCVVSLPKYLVSKGWNSRRGMNLLALDQGAFSVRVARYSVVKNPAIANVFSFVTDIVVPGGHAGHGGEVGQHHAHGCQCHEMSAQLACSTRSAPAVATQLSSDRASDVSGAMTTQCELCAEKELRGSYMNSF